MQLRHFLLGKFTARVLANDDSDSKKYLDSEILALYPSESVEFFRSLHNRLEPIIRALNPPRAVERKGSNQEAVLRLVIPRDISQWLYIRIFPSAPLDHMSREVMRYHAVLLSEQDLCDLKWRPWRLDPYLFKGISADKVEGVPASHKISLGEKEVPIEFDIDFRMLDEKLDEKKEQAHFSEQLIDHICSASEEGPVFITERSDLSALMDLLGEVAARRYSKEPRGRIFPLALGLRRVKTAKEAITNYQLSLLPPNANVTHSGLATLERGTGYFPIRGWKEICLPELQDGEDKSAKTRGAAHSSATSRKPQLAKPSKPDIGVGTDLEKRKLIRKPGISRTNAEPLNKQLEESSQDRITHLEKNIQQLLDENRELNRKLRDGQMRLKKPFVLFVLILSLMAALGFAVGWAARSSANAESQNVIAELKKQIEETSEESKRSISAKEEQIKRLEAENERLKKEIDLRDTLDKARRAGH